MSPHEELFQIADQLGDQAAIGLDSAVVGPIESLRDAVNAVSKSFSGSWLGYHAYVYYGEFTAPPAGHHFSTEWGLIDRSETIGDWRERDFDSVRNFILESAGRPDLSRAKELASKADSVFESAKADILSLLQNELDSGSDTFLESLRETLIALEPLSPIEVANRLQSKGQIMTCDNVAVGQGTKLPAHIAVKSEYRSIQHSFAICREAEAVARKAASHLERKSRRRIAEGRVGTNIFIGHGRSPMWRDLKDFLQDRLRLPWDEFNRVPVAGLANVVRLAEMLDAAAVAFIVMTGEDELADGRTQARMNVIHEAGLFQGRLGFTKAILLLEDGCEEFSNIHGLGQIRFPRGNISAVFEDIRRVLEREGVLS